MAQKVSPIWFALGHLANDWPIAALWLIVPAIGISMDLTPFEVGLLFTLFNVGGALAYLPAGILADHAANRGRLLVWTFWWVSAGYVASSLAPGFWSLAILLAIAGMGNAAWHPIATGVLTRESKEARAHALGVHAIGGSLAEVLAPISVGVLLTYLDWRSVLIVSVIPSLLMGLFFLRVSRSVPRVEKKRFGRRELLSFISIWRRGNGRRITIMICLYNTALMALLSMIPLFLANVYDFEAALIGFTFSALLVTGALAQPWVGKLSDTIGRRPILVYGNTAAAIASAILIFQPSIIVVIPALIVAVAALDAIRAAMLATMVDHSDENEGTTLGLAFVLLDGIGALGAVVAGFAAGFSWPAMFGLAAVLSLAAAILGGSTKLGHPETPK